MLIYMKEVSLLISHTINMKQGDVEMNSKRFRQYVGILAAIISYYIVHEGAHLITALFMGVFKEARFLWLGMQIDVYQDRMTDLQMGIFCIMGAVCTFLAAILLVIFAPQICRLKSKIKRAIFYYVTIAMLLIDPLYLSVLCDLFGGGDMNGIKLLLPEAMARIGFGALLILNALLFIKRILPIYTASFKEKDI